MLLRNRFVLMVVLATLAVLMGCSSTNKAAPPPTGGFGDTNLSGTYVFSTAGSDSVNGFFLTMVGTFTACGCAGGTISAGVVDMNDPGFPAPVVQLAITGGSYSVSVDGRGTATLNTATATPFSTSKIVLDFVLSSNQGGLVTEFDNNGSGSGTLDLQTSVGQSDLAGTYVFNLAGISGLSLSDVGVPLATVGSVTLNSSGSATGGVQDINNNSAYNSQAIGAGSNVTLGTRNTATIAGLNFDVYPIDSTHLKFIETDVAPILVGDVFSQTSSSFPSGELAFTMAGIDYSAATPGPLAVGGMMNAAGTTISDGVEDVNDAGNSNITSSSPISPPLAFTGSITPSGGRFFVTLDNFANGAGGTVGNYAFAAYPSTGGTQLLEVDNGGITGGVAYPQNSTSFASGQGYGLNLTGTNESSEEDDIAEFTNTSNALSGLIDVNDEGDTQKPQNFAGLYTADTSNPGRAIITTTQGGVNLMSYTVDGTNSIFVEIDPYQVAIGSIGQQASESQGAIATRMAVLRPRALPRGAWKKRPVAVRSGPVEAVSSRCSEAFQGARATPVPLAICSSRNRFRSGR